MKYSKYLFIVSAIAMVSYANADTAAVTGLATPNYVDGAIKSLSDVARTGSYNDLEDKPTLGALAEKETISNTDVAADAAIATSKIAGLDTALSGKQLTSNIVNLNADGEIAADDAGSTTKYPSMKVAEQIAKSVASDAVSQVSDDVTALQGKVDSLGALAKKDAVASADITDGSIAAVDLASNSVTTAKIADSAVTAAKTSGVIGYIPSGSATSTTYAQIWVQ